MAVPRLEPRANAPLQVLDDVGGDAGVNVNAGCGGCRHGLVLSLQEWICSRAEQPLLLGERNKELKTGGRAVKDDRRGGGRSARSGAQEEWEEPRRSPKGILDEPGDSPPNAI